HHLRCLDDPNGCGLVGRLVEHGDTLGDGQSARRGSGGDGYAAAGGQGGIDQRARPLAVAGGAMEARPMAGDGFTGLAVKRLMRGGAAIGEDGDAGDPAHRYFPRVSEPRMPRTRDSPARRATVRAKLLNAASMGVWRVERRGAERACSFSSASRASSISASRRAWAARTSN